MNLSKGEKRSLSPSNEPRRKLKRCRSVAMTINCSYLSSEFKEVLKEAHRTKTLTKYKDNVDYYSEPFPICVLPNFINEQEALKRLKEELLIIPFREKNNDLYTFLQSDDLSNINTRYIKSLKKLLYEDFRSVLTEITGIELNDKLDITCSQYSYGDVLLCHDDELEERRIAFIVYLVPAWKEEDGGTLDLFDCDAKGHPGSIVKSFLPVWNNFIFFEVSEKSFHQVSEVLSLVKTRLTISGWFHGPPLERSPSRCNLPYELKSSEFISEQVIRSWINPIYLQSEIQMEIQEKFQNESEIKLNDFLQEDKFLQVEKAFLENNLCWTDKGPADKCNYQQIDENSLPLIIKECVSLFQSEAMFLILSNCTGLSLHTLIAKLQKQDSDSTAVEAGTSTSCIKDEEKEKAKCRGEIRNWRHGSYMLIHDNNKENIEFALDVTLYFNCNDWNLDYGGFTSYIAKNEDEELLSVCPLPNSLALVYRDQETLRFVKYINSRVKERPLDHFQDIFFVYYE